MSIPRTAINRPVASTMLMLGMIFIGIVAILTLNIALFPDLDIPIAFVEAIYPGVEPEEMETIVTRNIEEQVNTVEGIDKMESYTVEGYSRVVLTFDYGTNIDLATVDLRAKVNLAKRNLPRDIEQTTVAKVDLNAQPIINLAIGGDYDLVELRRITEKEIKPAFQRITGVANVDIHGGREREIRIKILPDKLLALNLTIDDVIKAVSNDNKNTPLGSIEEGSFKYLLKAKGEIGHPQQLKLITIKEINSTTIYLGDVAIIEDSYKDIESVARINGKPAVTIGVKKQAGANPVEISDAARVLIPQLEKKYKGKLNIIIGKDSTDFTKDSIEMVKSNALAGGLLAMAVLFIFLKNYRATIIIGISLPIAILAALGLMTIKSDVTLNLMTLGGLALGIGMMVDNAVVVIENIFRFYRNDKTGDKIELAAQASEEVLMPIIASTATTVAVFLPIGFVPDIIGEVFFNMSLSIIFSLLASLVMASTFIPMLCSRFLDFDSLYLEDIILRMYKSLFNWAKHNIIKTIASILGLISIPAVIFFFKIKNHLIEKLLSNITFASHLHTLSPLMAGITVGTCLIVIVIVAPILIAITLKLLNIAFNKLLFPLFDFIVMNVIRNTYVFMLKHMLKKWYIGLAYVIFVFIAFYVSLEFQPAMGFFPDMDKGEFIVSFESPEGTSVNDTDIVTKKIEAVLREFPEVKNLTVNSSVGKGVVNVKLVSKALRNRTTNDIVSIARVKITQIPGYRTINFNKPKMGKPSNGKSIQIEVLGDDFSVIESICQKIYTKIKDVKGLKDLEDGIKKGRPEMQVIFDREKIRDMGLSLGKISNMTRSYLFGSFAGKYKEQNDEYDIRVEAIDASKDKIAKFMHMQIALEKNKFIKLSQIARFIPSTGYSTVNRKNMARRLIVQADPEGRPIGALVSDISERIKDIKIPTGYQIEFGGENKDMKKAFGYLAAALLASILLVYMIMAAQFESFIYPFIIMFTIPLSYMGVVLALNISNFEFSITAMIGIIMLAGIAVNNGIILIEYILQRRELLKESSVDAAIQAGSLRFRPILMTVFTTLLGMSPLALGIGAGSDFYQPLAITVMGGLAISTLLTLTFVPVLFILLEHALNLVKTFIGQFIRSNNDETPIKSV